jgi:hypothetical protein
MKSVNDLAISWKGMEHARNPGDPGGREVGFLAAQRCGTKGSDVGSDGELMPFSHRSVPCFNCRWFLWLKTC